MYFASSDQPLFEIYQQCSCVFWLVKATYTPKRLLFFSSNTPVRLIVWKNTKYERLNSFISCTSLVAVCVLLQQFNVHVSNWFSTLTVESDSIQQKYDNHKKSISKTAEQLLGKPQKKTSKKWVSSYTDILVSLRIHAKSKYRQHKTDTTKAKWRAHARKVVKSYENSYLESKMNDLQPAARMNECL